MRTARTMGKGRLLLELLRAEGPRALRDRLLDRLAEARRRRSFPLQAAAPEPPARPGVQVLNVLSAPPAPRFGGVEAQLLARLEEEARLRPVALLYPWGGRWRLEVAAGGGRWAIALDGPVPPTQGGIPLPAGAGAVATVERAAELVAAPMVHLETALRLPMAALAERLDGRLVLSVHDFALFCPRPHLVEEPAGAFCGYSTDDQRCGRCLAADGEVPTTVADHRAAAVRLLAASRVVLFPSRFLAEKHRELFPGLAGDWRVIEPGVPATALPAWATGPRRPPRVAFLGGGDPHKGAGAFAALVAFAVEHGSPIEWWCFGGGDRRGLLRLRQSGVTVCGYYRWGTLPALLRRQGIEVALLLPTVPESFSLALSECRRAGVPVVATRIGALAERMGSADGLLVEPGAGAAGLLTAVAGVLTRAPAREPARVPMAADAARAHVRLYRELVAGG